MTKKTFLALIGAYALAGVAVLGWAQANSAQVAGSAVVRDTNCEAGVDYGFNVAVLSFQDTVINGEPQSKGSTVYNTSDKVCTVDAVNVVAGPEFQVQVPSLPRVLKPGENFSVTVIFTPPGVAGTYTVELSL